MAKIISSVNPKNDIVAYILAGGESRRFDKKIKGLQLLKNKSLIEHVIDRLTPQINALNINTHIQEYAQFGYPLVSDSDTFFKGPLSGLLACMQHLHAHHPTTEWLMIAPCDSPFIPHDLTDQLYEGSDNFLASCIRYQNNLQPPFSLWHKSLLQKLEHAVIQEEWGGLKIFLKSLGEAVNVIEYPEQINSPFFNINCKEELQEAEQFNHEQI